MVDIATKLVETNESNQHTFGKKYNSLPSFVAKRNFHDGGKLKAKLLKIDVFKNRAALSTRKLCCSLDIVLILFPCDVCV